MLLTKYTNQGIRGLKEDVGNFSWGIVLFLIKRDDIIFVLLAFESCHVFYTMRSPGADTFGNLVCMSLEHIVAAVVS